MKTPSAWISAATLKLAVIIWAIAQRVWLPNMNEVAGRPVKTYWSRYYASLILPVNCAHVQRLRPVCRNARLQACSWPAHVKARGGREKNRKTKQNTNQNHATFWQCSTIWRQLWNFFFSTAARIVSKELQVILKVTINSFQGSKWIQSLEQGGRCPGTWKFSAFPLSCVGFLVHDVTIVSRWRVTGSMEDYKRLPGATRKSQQFVATFLNLVRWKESKIRGRCRDYSQRDTVSQWLCFSDITKVIFDWVQKTRT